MKKTMIALAAAAALATSGAAFAQATITGFMAYGYGVTAIGKNATTTASNSGGFGLDTAELYITAKEDLGGGMTAGGTMGFGGLGRGESLYGHNYTMYVQNAMGKLTLGAVKSGDYISSGLASSGVNYYDFGDKGNFGKRTSRDIISLDFPVGPISLTLSHQEGGDQTGSFGGAEGSTGQRLSIVSATYAADALKVNAQYFTADNQVANSQSSLASVIRLSGNYNLGVATVGAGIQRQNLVFGNTATNLGFSAALPMGALTLGVMVGSRVTEGFTTVDTGNAKTSTSTAMNGTQASYSLNANYALSKRTGVTGQFSNWDNGVGGDKSSHTMLLLTHSF